MDEGAGRRFGAQGRTSVCSGSDGEGPDCLRSRASLANWNVWVHGVQEDPLGAIAVKQQRNCAVVSRTAGRTFVKDAMDVLLKAHGGVPQTVEQPCRLWRGRRSVTAAFKLLLAAAFGAGRPGCRTSCPAPVELRADVCVCIWCESCVCWRALCNGNP